MTDFFIPQKTKKDHWYKEPWMLLVLGGPLIVVIAGFLTFYIAWHGSDNIVSKDYYKQGVNIDKTLLQEAKAREYKMQAEVIFDRTSGKITLNLKGETNLPSAVLLTISYKTQESEFEAEQKVALSQMSYGVLQGSMKIPTDNGKINLDLWHIKIEGADWRLAADWPNPLHSSVQIKI